MERGNASFAVEEAKQKCVALKDRIIGSSINPKETLLRLIQSELSFIHRISASNQFPSVRSFNIGHLEAVVHVLLQPSVTGVSRVCKSIPFSASRSIHVDIVCSLNGIPVWVVVSDRNPRYFSWESQSFNWDKGLKNKIHQVVDAASLSHLTVKPVSVVFFFSNGLDENIYQKIQNEFDAIDLKMDMFSYDEVVMENEWTNVVLGRSFTNACVVEIKVDRNGSGMLKKNNVNISRIDSLVSCNKSNDCFDKNLGKSFCSLLVEMKSWCCSLDGSVSSEVELLKESLVHADTKLFNLDTTAMIAIVSGISNGGIERFLATPEIELRERYKGNYDFVIAQVNSEIQNPIHHELSVATMGKIGIICDTVHLEFQELISMCGGPKEKLRAKYLLKLLKVVPDCSSTRLSSLPTTRKLDLKNKVVFGTGDYWNAPTVTANRGFVRAISQTGMSLSVIEHKPRALIGD